MLIQKSNKMFLPLVRIGHYKICTVYTRYIYDDDET